MTGPGLSSVVTVEQLGNGILSIRKGNAFFETNPDKMFEYKIFISRVGQHVLWSVPVTMMQNLAVETGRYPLAIRPVITGSLFILLLLMGLLGYVTDLTI